MKISEISLPKIGSIWSIWLSAAFTIRSLSRSSFSLSRNDHVVEAQLPAYCFMPIRNDTYCGQIAPNTIGKSANTTTPASSAGFMSPSPYPLPAGKLANRNAAQKMKKTFHSSGTASGMVEMMNVWSIHIDTIAIHVSHGHGENSRVNGITISAVVPPTWATHTA